MTTARSASGFSMTAPSPEQRTRLEAELSAQEAQVLLRHGTEAPFCGAFLKDRKSVV